ncbi:DUF2177 family protein [Gellertiella hungarica]|uniref:Putative membrane protein n=1 Tax=Gellertiella hungarica TaxID=1572859 RepID=A0A7W6J814_9HYPH|nr:DUF2177 family protein [Gellertiella hungarica]MBB4065657.1 putative membrane protein [Gellertiella hungarica]
MKTYAVAYGGAIVTLLVLDAIWLGLMARSFYVPKLGHLMAEQPNFAIAALFYLFYAVAVAILASVPGFSQASLATALGFGAVLGFAAYGTYDFTNLATLKDWPVVVTVVDIIWGTVVTAASAAGGYLALKWFA